MPSIRSLFSAAVIAAAIAATGGFAQAHADPEPPPSPVVPWLDPADAAGAAPVEPVPTPEYGAAPQTGAVPEAGVIVDVGVPSDVPAAGNVPVSELGAIDTAAIIYERHDVPQISDADIEAGLRAAGVADPLVPVFAAAARIVIGGESGGNPNAVNLHDSNAHGQTQTDGAPANSSRGAMQTIPATFATHHAPGTSTVIYNPVANIAAAWRYINARYRVDLGTGSGLDAFLARGTGRGVGY